jgi:chromosome segregation ATPase
MNTFLSFVKKMPFWFWIALAVFIFLAWQSLSGWAMSRKLYKMALNNLRQDQTQIIKEKDAWIKTCEDEIKQLAIEKERIQKEKAAVQQQANQSAAEVARLKGENNALRKQIRDIIIPDDPDRIIDDLRKRFPTIRKIQP